MRSMALKVNVSVQDREVINQLLEKAGFPPQKKKFHCTLGFIEKMIPEEEVLSFGNKITQELQEYVDAQPLIYEIEKVAHLFRHVIVFLPTEKSRLDLRKANLWLHEKVKEVSNQRWNLNRETVPENYIPHMTVWRTPRLDDRFKTLEELTKPPLAFQLTEAGFVLF